MADRDPIQKFLKNADFCLTTRNQSGLNSFLDCPLELGELEFPLDLMAHKALVTTFKHVYFKVFYIPPQNKMGRPVTIGYSLVGTRATLEERFIIDLQVRSHHSPGRETWQKVGMAEGTSESSYLKLQATIQENEFKMVASL